MAIWNIKEVYKKTMANIWPQGSTRGLFGGGYPSTDTMDYITIATLGNATDFGNLSQARYYLAAISGD